jgi:hypothetical protein
MSCAGRTVALKYSDRFSVSNKLSTTDLGSAHQRITTQTITLSLTIVCSNIVERLLDMRETVIVQLQFFLDVLHRLTAGFVAAIADGSRHRPTR